MVARANIILLTAMGLSLMTACGGESESSQTAAVDGQGDTIQQSSSCTMDASNVNGVSTTKYVVDGVEVNEQEYRQRCSGDFKPPMDGGHPGSFPGNGQNMGPSGPIGPGGPSGPAGPMGPGGANTDGANQSCSSSSSAVNGVTKDKFVINGQEVSEAEYNARCGLGGQTWQPMPPHGPGAPGNIDSPGPIGGRQIISQFGPCAVVMDHGNQGPGFIYQVWRT